VANVALLLLVVVLLLVAILLFSGVFASSAAVATQAARGRFEQHQEQHGDHQTRPSPAHGRDERQQGRRCRCHRVLCCVLGEFTYRAFLEVMDRREA